MSSFKPIVLAEDSSQDVELTMAAFQEYNIVNTVVVVRDGQELLDYLYVKGSFANRAPGNPALVLLDLKMPKMDGLEALQVIKADESLKTIPVVMLTSSREEVDLVRSYELGVNAYVVKPVEFQAFINAVREIGAFWAVLNETPSKSGARKE
jgi:CheY-like chemotaxis protein